MTKIQLYIFSDSIGETNEQVVHSLTAQFPNQTFKQHKFTHLITPTLTEEALQEVDTNTPAILFYTCVQPETITLIRSFGATHHIPCVDLLSHGLEAIASVCGESPRGEPGLIRQLDQRYFDRIKAIEFAVKYDDGQDPRGILKADLVLIGVSRTSKTPLAMYLSNRQLKVANIPLLPESRPPKELFAIPPERIIGLTNQLEFLKDIRQHRLAALGLSPAGNYTDTQRILAELTYAEDIMHRLGCPIINVANKAIEETAGEILAYLETTHAE